MTATADPLLSEQIKKRQGVKNAKAHRVRNLDSRRATRDHRLLRADHLRETQMRTNQEHTFSRIPQANIPRSTFSRTHGHKTTFDSGFLIPFYVDEVLPGDTFAVSASIFARITTPTVPVMDNAFCDVFYFYVPNRLLWEHWQNFMGELEDPDDLGQIDYLMPSLATPASTGLISNTLADYMGIPVGVPGLMVNPLPFRAYNLIWNEWFRDQNLQSKVTVTKTDAGDSWAHFNLLRRNKRHDYFTSSLPWPQKGPGVMIPLGQTAPVIPNPANMIPRFAAGGSSTTQLQADNSNAVWITTPGAPPALHDLEWSQNDGEVGLIADLNNATAATINSLREAFQIQKLYERDARGGTRYTEIIRSHFGVVSPDSRLQRPEYLGGGTMPLTLTPTVQTSGSPSDIATGYAKTPQGNLAATGVVQGNSLGFTKSFVEHGYILGLLEVRADLTYQQGLNRMWSRSTKVDFYWPVLAHLGEQAVLNKEIYAQGSDDAAADAAAWGYQERWAEYRYYPSLITGNMRAVPIKTGAVEAPEDSLQVWHYGVAFDNLPTLSDQFIQDTPPIKRTIAVTNQPEFFADIFISSRATRPMPVYSVPGLIDHF